CRSVVVGADGLVGNANSTQNEPNCLMDKLFARHAIIHYWRSRQMHDGDHGGQMMRKKASILGLHGAGNDVAGFAGGVDTGINLLQATIEMGREEKPREIAVLETTVQDQPMPRFPANWIIWFAYRDAPHDVVNDVD